MDRTPPPSDEEEDDGWVPLPPERDIEDDEEPES